MPTSRVLHTEAQWRAHIAAARLGNALDIIASILAERAPALTRAETESLEQIKLAGQEVRDGVIARSLPDAKLPGEARA